MNSQYKPAHTSRLHRCMHADCKTRTPNWKHLRLNETANWTNSYKVFSYANLQYPKYRYMGLLCHYNRDWYSYSRFLCLPINSPSLWWCLLVAPCLNVLCSSCKWNWLYICNVINHYGNQRFYHLLYHLLYNMTLIGYMSQVGYTCYMQCHGRL